MYVNSTHAVSDRKRESAVKKGQKASETAPWRLPIINTHDAFGGASGAVERGWECGLGWRSLRKGGLGGLGLYTSIEDVFLVREGIVGFAYAVLGERPHRIG